MMIFRFTIVLIILMETALAATEHSDRNLMNAKMMKRHHFRPPPIPDSVPPPPPAPTPAVPASAPAPMEEDVVSDSTETCTIGPEAAVQGTCAGRPNSFKFIVNSCGDVYGPTVVERVLEATGADISRYNNKTVFSEAWAYMESLRPNDVFLAGDNVYNDAIANWGQGYHPYGNNLATILKDASEPFLKYHGFLTEDGRPGPLYYSYLEALKDKLQDGYLDNDEFKSLRAFTNNGIHATWDDHDYLTNDPSNPHYLRHEFRKAEIDALTGWDRNYFRFGPSHKGIERTWTTELVDHHGSPFLVRFIILDEETTHNGTQGCTYYYNPESPTGFTPRLTRDSSTPCPDLDVVEDFEQDEPARGFYGNDQLEWFREQLMKPSDLTFVLTGGPNWETDYDYTSITEYPGEKRKLIELLRETGAEHVIFLTGDSHASYVTKVPNIVGYPLYTIVGSGLTQGLSYDRYVGFWGDISHRFLVAAGSTNGNNAAASFAEVDIMFDEEGPFVRFTPHLRNGLPDNQGWEPWYKQEIGFENEPWDAQYDIRVSDLEIDPSWPRYHYDSTIEHKFVTEVIYLRWTNTTGPAEDLEVTLSITNSKGETKSFPLVEGRNCGSGNFGFCKDRWGAFSYTATTVGTYAPSIVNQEICEHAGFVGDEIRWSIQEDGEEVANGSTLLKFRNTVLVNSQGPEEDLYHYGTQGAYNSVSGLSVGVDVIAVINEPEVYGGFKVPVKGWTGNGFDDSGVQSLYEQYLAAEEPRDATSLQAAYLSTYYPDLPKL